MQIICKYTRIAPILSPWTRPLGQNLRKLCYCWLSVTALSLGKVYCQDECVFVGELHPLWASVWVLLRVLDSPFSKWWLAWHFMILLIKLCVKEIERHVPSGDRWSKPHRFMRTNWPFLSWMLIRNKWDQSYANCISTPFKAASLFQNPIFFFFNVPFYSPLYLIYCLNRITFEPFNFVSEWNVLLLGFRLFIVSNPPALSICLVQRRKREVFPCAAKQHQVDWDIPVCLYFIH